ncbi:MAG TPA: CDP-diacylglycerol--glycerol-3-phosphate 3-phosphatidyltransferase [Lachnospiraceae bacterium]|nr:CDP-diacylglycerol--glycerol-3-phosphate 3-phosphatidyltransferase [Lachnospiraceae bacterium]
MNLPNKLTVVRVILIPFFVFFLLLRGGRGTDLAALFIFVIASLTDWFDGRIARKYGLITDFGKFMDPLADKLLVCSALICFVELGRLPAWIVVIIISREFIISGFRLIAADNGVVIAAGIWGKFKTVSQMVMIIMLLADTDRLLNKTLVNTVIGIAVVLTVVSLIDYLYKNRDVMKEQK